MENDKIMKILNYIKSHNFNKVNRLTYVGAELITEKFYGWKQKRHLDKKKETKSNEIWTEKQLKKWRRMNKKKQNTNNDRTAW